MITFIVPTFNNVKGLETVVSQLNELCTTDFEIIVLFSSSDVNLANGISVLTSEKHEARTRYYVYDSPSLTAKVNHAAMTARRPVLCVLNDSIMLSKLNRGFDAAITERFLATKDEILALYLCNKEETDNDLRFPFISRRVIDLVGYLYHPILAVPPYCERWYGEILNRIGRVQFMTGCPIFDNVEVQSSMTYTDDVMKETELIYRSTGTIRRWTAESLSAFLVR